LKLHDVLRQQFWHPCSG